MPINKYRLKCRKFMTKFAEKTTIHGIPDIYDPEGHIVIKISWAIVFLGALAVLAYQGAQIIQQYWEQPTTTQARAAVMPKGISDILQVCVEANKVIHPNASSYGLTGLSKNYAEHMWLGPLLNSGMQMLTAKNDEFFPIWKQEYDGMTWDELRKNVLVDMEAMKTEFTTVLEDDSSVWYGTISDFFSLSSDQPSGSHMNLQMSSSKIVNGPYAVLVEPNLVCWDIPGTPLAGQSYLWQFHYFVHHKISKGEKLLHHSPFLGQNHIFGIEHYSTVVYPNRDYDTKMIQATFSSSPTENILVDRRKHPCQNLSMPFHCPFNARKGACLDECHKEIVEQMFNCSFSSDDFENFCHKFLFLKHFLVMSTDELADSLSDTGAQLLKTYIDWTKLTGVQDVENAKAGRYKHRFKYILAEIAILFKTKYLNPHCQKKCQHDRPYCESWSFSRYQMDNVKTPYAENETDVKIHPLLGPGDHGNLGKRFVLELQINPSPTYMVFEQELLMPYLANSIMNLGGLCGFYLGISVLSVIQIFVYCLCYPWFAKSGNNVVSKPPSKQST